MTEEMAQTSLLTLERKSVVLSFGQSTKGKFSHHQLTMEDQICQYIQSILDYADGSEEQRRAIDRLSRVLLQLPGIYRCGDLDYNLALNQALANLAGIKSQGTFNSRNIRSFLLNNNINLREDSPTIVSQLLVKWFNKILKRRIFDLYRGPQNNLSLDQLIGDNSDVPLVDTVPDPRPSDLERQIQQEELAELHRVIEEAKTQLLNCYPKGYPHCNCLVLIEKRLIQYPAQKWEDIAKELNVPYGTVTAHWNRKCTRILQELAKNYQKTN